MRRIARRDATFSKALNVEGCLKIAIARYFSESRLILRRAVLASSARASRPPEQKHFPTAASADPARNSSGESSKSGYSPPLLPTASQYTSYRSYRTDSAASPASAQTALHEIAFPRVEHREFVRNPGNPPIILPDSLA